MNYACFTDTNGLAINYFLLDKEEERVRKDIAESLKIIYGNCAREGYNGSTSAIVETDLKLAYSMIMPMGRKELRYFRDLIRPIESTDIDRSDLERRLSEVEQLAYH